MRPWALWVVISSRHVQECGDRSSVWLLACFRGLELVASLGLWKKADASLHTDHEMFGFVSASACALSEAFLAPFKDDCGFVPSAQDRRVA